MGVSFLIDETIANWRHLKIIKINNDHKCLVTAEMTSMANTDSMLLAAKRLHLVPHSATTIKISLDTKKWVRSGGESYSLPFRCSTDGLIPRHAIFKAIISIKPTIKARAMLNRRQHLKNEGIKTPQLFGYNKAVLLEEFIEDSIDVAAMKNIKNTLQQSACVFGILAKMGHNPLSGGIMRDFRFQSDGSIVMIDFGSDLGDRCNTATTCLRELFQAEAKATLGVSSHLINHCVDHYNAAKKGVTL